MKKLKIWNDSNGSIIFEEFLCDIKILKVENETLYVLLENGFNNTYSLVDDGFNYSFRIG